MTHWTLHYLGLPWVAGETDCWNFARRVWGEHFGWYVPAVELDATSPLEARRWLRVIPPRWTETGTPREGDAVLMMRGAMPCHVGIYLDGGAVLHSVEGAGVICTPPGGILRTGYQVKGIYGWQE